MDNQIEVSISDSSSVSLEPQEVRELARTLGESIRDRYVKSVSTEERVCSLENGVIVIEGDWS